MGNNHNLLAFPTKPYFIGEDGYIIKKVINGATLATLFSAVRFDAVHLHDTSVARLQRWKEGRLSNNEGSKV